MDGTHKRTLEEAIQVLGSKERLAVVLDMSLADLEEYLSGEALPHNVFIEVLDIVAGSPRSQP